MICAAIETDRPRHIGSLTGLRGIPLLLMVVYMTIVLLHLMLLSPIFMRVSAPTLCFPACT
jgi:hypothetical protein